MTSTIECAVIPSLSLFSHLYIRTLLCCSICSSVSMRVKQKMRDCLDAVSQDPFVDGMKFQARYTVL